MHIKYKIYYPAVKLISNSKMLDKSQLLLAKKINSAFIA